MSNSATITNEIKQQLASISMSLIKVHNQIEHAGNCHDATHTATVLHNVQDASDYAEVINQNAYDLPGAFAKLRQVVISYTTSNDPTGSIKWWKEDQHKRGLIYPAEFRMADTMNFPDDFPNNELIMCVYDEIHKKFNGDITKINNWYKEAKNEYYEKNRERKKKMMETSMNKELPPTTPTRRIKPTVCPPAPKKKSKWRAGNRYSALASSSNEPYSTMGSSSRSKSPPSPSQDRRRGGRPCPPGCCAPPTPQVSAVSPPVGGFEEYIPGLWEDGLDISDGVPDAIDLNDYDMWGRKIHYDLF